ncbi:helix-turn-helix domain-containing protein [Tuanshanicoccus lijuaniae]|uniref:AraC family transcriptional regulator n=1 Tax=Aerococcaceae bacterium zg-1292 TaxID=2774330 RepID=UPI001935E957|nr:helix-turn-helix domain-containing protein [Aerococcaceae bacterium zg-1292]MBF6626399.1 helix-turn-helix domain-containing protein [Aerococcaceae bacterium zg-BR9]MBS4455728.1 helix-turn-helix domain-containing protein [Aerococcaceae bacterium zg-A91]MBS4457479.1 helix-turn-helix domain-containing protein [Aerococcaceae bacterium zg-BR33]QQA37077.1 helix-turn-helix domain-containing protein [Aerococcaceae bacterium zg-1292]
MRKLWVYFQNEDADLSIDECGIQAFSVDEHYSYNAYQHFILHYVQSGEGYFEVNQQHYHLKAGDGFIIRSSEYVTYYPDVSNPWTTYWVGISGSDFEKYIGNTEIMSAAVITYHPDGETQKIIQTICDTTLDREADLPGVYWYKGQLFLLVEALKKEFSSHHIQRAMPAKSSADTAYDYIYANYMKDITINHVAEYIGVSRSYLYKLFKQKFLFSPQQFLLDRRLTIAASLLLTTDLSMAEVAEKVGFKDALYFSKSFSKYYGKSPSKFRAQHDYDSYKESEDKLPYRAMRKVLLPGEQNQPGE